MIPEIGILDWVPSTSILGNDTPPHIIPEIGILDWLSSNPSLGNDIPPLYNPRNWDTRLVI